MQDNGNKKWISSSGTLRVHNLHSRRSGAMPWWRSVSYLSGSMPNVNWINFLLCVLVRDDLTIGCAVSNIPPVESQWCVTAFDWLYLHIQEWKMLNVSPPSRCLLQPSGGQQFVNESPCQLIARIRSGINSNPGKGSYKLILHSN